MQGQERYSGSQSQSSQGQGEKSLQERGQQSHEVGWQVQTRGS